MTQGCSRAAQRIAGLDVARGLAVLGMFAAHLQLGRELTWAPATWTGVVNGRPAILFATLAGASIALLSGRQHPVAGDDLVRARLRILVRAAWVFLLGGLLELLGTDVNVILGAYAVLFVLAVPFLRWPPRRLLALAGVLAVLGPPLDVVVGQVATAQDAGGQPFASLAFTGAYPVVVWWAFVLVGMAIGRLGLGAAPVRTRLLATGAGATVVGYVGGWASTRVLAGGRSNTDGLREGFDHLGRWQSAWLSGAAPHSGTTFDIVGSTGVAAMVIAVSLIVADRWPRLTAPMGAVGAMALSVYCAHLVALWIIHPGYDPEPRVWAAFTLVALVAALLWRRLVGQGPLERLLTWSSNAAARPSTRTTTAVPQGTSEARAAARL